MKTGQSKQKPVVTTQQPVKKTLSTVVQKPTTNVQASQPKQQSVTAKPDPVSSVPPVADKSPIIIPQSNRVRSQQTQQNLAPAAKTPEDQRIEKQKLASKAARQQMGIKERFNFESFRGK